MKPWRWIKHFLYTEGDLFSRRLNAYRSLSHTSAVSLSRATAIEAIEGDLDAQKRQMRINCLFRFFTGEINHCVNELLTDESEAEALVELCDGFRAEGKL